MIGGAGAAEPDLRQPVKEADSASVRGEHQLDGPGGMGGHPHGQQCHNGEQQHGQQPEHALRPGRRGTGKTGGEPGDGCHSAGKEARRADKEGGQPRSEWQERHCSRTQDGHGRYERGNKHVGQQRVGGKLRLQHHDDRAAQDLG